MTRIEIIDRINGRSLSKPVNLVVDGDTKWQKLDYTIIPKIVGEQKEFRLKFNYPIQNNSVKEGLSVGKKVKEG